MHAKNNHVPAPVLAATHHTLVPLLRRYLLFLPMRRRVRARRIEIKPQLISNLTDLIGHRDQLSACLRYRRTHAGNNLKRIFQKFARHMSMIQGRFQKLWVTFAHTGKYLLSTRYQLSGMLVNQRDLPLYAKSGLRRGSERNQNSLLLRVTAFILRCW